jgi:hypothetical protein
LVPWKEHKAFLKEEADSRRMAEHNATVGYEQNSPIDRALEQVFESVADDVSYYRGCVSGSPAAIERVLTRAGIKDQQHDPVAFTDRQGTLMLPFDEALQIARRFCGIEPSTVLTGVEVTERDWEQKARRGETYIVGLLNEYRASWALVRQWAGHDAAIAQREAEIEKLERLVWDAVYALQKAGLDSEAARLRRAVEKTRG